MKVPLFPFHTWLPDAYETAPTGVSMVLTGVLSKMGVYGFVRLLLPLFPNEIKILAPWLLGLAVCSIVFASLAAWAQSDLKRMVAYLSINHLGYCMLGLFAVTATTTRPAIEMQAALSGVFMQIFNHGITAAALFYYVGLLEQRRGLRGIDDFGGLMQRTPLLCGWMSVAMFSSARPAGTKRIHWRISDLQRFIRGRGVVHCGCGARSSRHGHRLHARDASALQRSADGKLQRVSRSSSEAKSCVVVPVTLLMFAIGIAPQFVFNIFNTTVVQMARLVCLTTLTSNEQSEIIPDSRANRVRRIRSYFRGQKAMLSIPTWLRLYGVTTRNLNKAVNRNRSRFPIRLHVSTLRRRGASV